MYDSEDEVTYDSEEERRGDEAQKTKLQRWENWKLLTVYQSIFHGANIMKDYTISFLGKDCGKCKNGHEARSQNLKSKLKEDEFGEISRIVSVLFARSPKHWRHYIKYAEDNEIILDLTSNFYGNKVISSSILDEDIQVLRATLFYALRNKVLIDFQLKDSFGDTPLEISLSTNIKKISMLLDYIDKNRNLVKFNEKDRDEFLLVLGRGDELLEKHEKSEDPQSICMVGRIKYYQGKTEEALEIFNKLVIQNSQFSDGYNGKALIYSAQAKYEEALGQLDYAIAANPSNPLYDINKVRILLELGRNQEALDVLEDIDIKVASRYIDKLFNSAQKALFIQLIETTKEYASHVVSTSSASKDLFAVRKIVESFNGEIQISHYQAEIFRSELESIKQTIVEAGIHQQAEIRRGFQEFSETPELITYCKTFYWTTINLFNAYSILSTNLIIGNVSKAISISDQMRDSNVEKSASAIAKVAMKLGVELSKSIPMVGGLVGSIDKVIESVYKGILSKQLKNRVSIMNKIVQTKFITEDEMNKEVALISLDLTKLRHDRLLDVIECTSSEDKDTSDYTSFKSKISCVVEKFMNSTSMHDKSNNSTKIALEDVSMIFATLLHEHEKVIGDNVSLREYLQDILKENSPEKLLRSADSSDTKETILQETSSESSQVKPVGETGTSCCEIL